MAARGRRAEFSRAVAASPGLRDLANLGFLQLDLVRAYCALGDALIDVDDAERRVTSCMDQIVATRGRLRIKGATTPL